MSSLPRGPVFLDVAGIELAPAERERIAHPLVGGVILFARNYESPEQLAALTAAIRALRTPAPLIAVDHEGGRIQRFRQGFSAIPPMRTLGERWDRDVAAAAREAARVGLTIATELRAQGVDFSFTPVLDLDYGTSTVIGDRALHGNPNAVAHLACALRLGLQRGGMAAVGKHFPGHGHVAADSHVDVPVDERGLPALLAADLVPFAALIGAGLEAVMPAHVIYSAIDAQPAGYSSFWLREMLRGRMGFDGIVFSDDLGMAGARGAGDMVGRAEAACAAGCDMVLVCNDSAAADEVLDRWRPQPQPDLERRAARMDGRAPRGGPSPA
jgi:beta-N-acetylhexosaminidase